MHKKYDDLDQRVRKAIESKPIVCHAYRKAWLGKGCYVHGFHETTCGHHLIKGVGRGQRKASDCFIIPLCHECHTKVHLNEEKFFDEIMGDTDPREVAFEMFELWKEIK